MADYKCPALRNYGVDSRRKRSGRWAKAAMVARGEDSKSMLFLRTVSYNCSAEDANRGHRLILDYRLFRRHTFLSSSL